VPAQRTGIRIESYDAAGVEIIARPRRAIEIRRWIALPQ
jgi:hypothetical protein